MKELSESDGYILPVVFIFIRLVTFSAGRGKLCGRGGA